MAGQGSNSATIAQSERDHLLPEGHDSSIPPKEQGSSIPPKRQHSSIPPKGQYFFIPRSELTCELNYELPKAISSVRDGWQWTSQSGAVVSGLLAAAAAQLLSFFKTSSNFHKATHGVQALIVAACYAALFLNIGATITSFILIDNLGEIGYQASCNSEDLKRYELPGTKMTTPQEKLLVRFGASRMWRMMLVYWLITFYSGILALVISTLTYVIVEEPLATWVLMAVIVAFILLPSTFLIILRPCFERR